MDLVYDTLVIRESSRVFILQDYYTIDIILKLDCVEDF